MNVIVFIPSRYNSTRFPGKPLAPIAGEPMIRHVYRCAASCPDASEIYVATDDERIFRYVEDFGGNALMTGTEHPSGTDRIAGAVKKMDLDEDDIIVNIQGDQPFFDPYLISDMIAPLITDRNIPMSTLKYRITGREEIENTNIVKVVTDKDGFALYFSRYPIPFFRDGERSGPYYKHLGFYAFRKDFLIEFSSLPVGVLEVAEKLEQLRALENGFKIKVVETDSDSPEVDTPGDIIRVERKISGSQK